MTEKGSSTNRFGWLTDEEEDFGTEEVRRNE